MSKLPSYWGHECRVERRLRLRSCAAARMRAISAVVSLRVLLVRRVVALCMTVILIWLVMSSILQNASVCGLLYKGLAVSMYDYVDPPGIDSVVSSFVCGGAVGAKVWVRRMHNDGPSV